MGRGRHPAVGRQVHVYGRHQVRELAHARIGEFGRYGIVDEPFERHARLQRRIGFAGCGKEGKAKARIEREVVPEENFVLGIHGRLKGPVALRHVVPVFGRGHAVFFGGRCIRASGMVPVILGAEPVAHVVVLIRIPVPVGSKAYFTHGGNVFVVHGVARDHAFFLAAEPEVVAGVRGALRIV